MSRKLVTFSGDLRGGTARGDIRKNAYILLDAPSRHVSFYTVDGARVPKRVSNNHAALVRVNPDADLIEVCEVLEDIMHVLSDYFELYEGPRWDGHRYVGVWSDDERRAELLKEIETAIGDQSRASYWAAGDWFNSCRIETSDRLVYAMHALEGSLAAAVETVAKIEVERARGKGYFLELSAVITVLRGYAECGYVDQYRAGRVIEAMGLTWHVQPRDIGQTDEYAYAMHERRCFRRTTDRSIPADEPRSFYDYSDDVATFEPWNNVILGSDGGEVVFDGVEDIARELLAGRAE